MKLMKVDFYNFKIDAIIRIKILVFFCKALLVFIFIHCQR